MNDDLCDETEIMSIINIICLDIMIKIESVLCIYYYNIISMLTAINN